MTLTQVLELITAIAFTTWMPAYAFLWYLRQKREDTVIQAIDHPMEPSESPAVDLASKRLTLWVTICDAISGISLSASLAYLGLFGGNGLVSLATLLVSMAWAGATVINSQILYFWIRDDESPAHHRKAESRPVHLVCSLITAIFMVVGVVMTVINYGPQIVRFLLFGWTITLIGLLALWLTAMIMQRKNKGWQKRRRKYQGPAFNLALEWFMMISILVLVACAIWGPIATDNPIAQSLLEPLRTGIALGLWLGAVYCLKGAKKHSPRNYLRWLSVIGWGCLILMLAHIGAVAATL